MSDRDYSILDRFCLGVDQVLRTLSGNVMTTNKIYPAQSIEEEMMTDSQRKHSAALMRVNHAGEVCAQALYHGQACASKTSQIKGKMQQAALEEGDHLAWCEMRITELGSHTSYLNPVWYAGSFCIGMLAGMIGDKWSLGFVAETEKQVIKHLESHLALLPEHDARSYKILEQMEKDETQHQEEAIQLGAKELPDFIQHLMRLTSKIMVKTSYWV